MEGNGNAGLRGRCPEEYHVAAGHVVDDETGFRKRLDEFAAREHGQLQMLTAKSI